MLALLQWARSFATTGAVVIVTLALYAAVFIPLERLFPSIRRQKIWRWDSPTDAAYWLAVPLVNGFCGLAAPVVCSTLFGHACPALPSRRFLESLPVVLQVVVYAFLIDLVQYWWHRALHTRPFWRIHAVHHSMVELDWLSAYRRHPIEMVLMSSLNVWLWTLTFSPAAIALYASITAFTNYLPHANLNWTYGPLRYIFVSPVYHRWHHTGVEEAGMKNFANFFSCIDLLFGTYYAPAGESPKNFGCAADRVPEHFWGQMAYPFRKKPVPLPPPAIPEPMRAEGVLSRS